MFTYQRLIDCLIMMFYKNKISEILDFTVVIVDYEGKIINTKLYDIPYCFDCNFNHFIVNNSSKLIKIYMEDYNDRKN